MFISYLNGAPEGAPYIIGLGSGLFPAVPAFAAFGKKYTITMVDDIGTDNPLFAVVGPPPIGGISYSSNRCLLGHHWRTGYR